jgi:hypothetical protein
LKIILFLKCGRKKFGPIFKELYNFLLKKLPLSSQNYGFGIRKKTYPGSRGQKSTGSRVKKAPDPGSKSATLAKRGKEVSHGKGGGAGSGFEPLTNGSGSTRPKNIRIHNTTLPMANSFIF